MKRLFVFFAGLLLAFSAAAQPVVVYKEGFESGVQPPGWSTWEGLSFPGSWDYSPALDGQFSAAFGVSSGLSSGAFYAFAQPLDDVTVSFSFECLAYPPTYIIEVIDLYDSSGNEIGDVYLSTGGQLLLTIGGSTGTCTQQVPLNRKIAIQFHYSNKTTPASAQATWTLSTSLFGGNINGVYRNDGSYTSPVSQFLLGPVSQPGVLFIYDDFTVTAN